MGVLGSIINKGLSGHKSDQKPVEDPFKSRGSRRPTRRVSRGKKSVIPAPIAVPVAPSGGKGGAGKKG